LDFIDVIFLPLTNVTCELLSDLIGKIILQFQPPQPSSQFKNTSSSNLDVSQTFNEDKTNEHKEREEEEDRNRSRRSETNNNNSMDFILQRIIKNSISHTVVVQENEQEERDQIEEEYEGRTSTMESFLGFFFFC